MRPRLFGLGPAPPPQRDHAGGPATDHETTMNCASCHHDNRSGRRFCAECGQPLVLACPSCAAANEPGEKFCGECGAPLVSSPPAAATPPGDRGGVSQAAPPGSEGGARKVVTIIFADLVGSTALHERLDAESAQRLMDLYYDVLRAVVEEAGGAVVKLLGDGVMAAFGLRQVAEDDALRAVRAAVAMQEAFAALAAERSEVLGQSGLRVAVHSGEVVVSGDHDDVVGDPVNVAARLQDQGASGEVVLGEATRRLVSAQVTLAPLGSVTLKGRSEAVAAYRLVSLDPPAEAAVAPFVGREEELRRLGMAFEVAARTPASRLAVLLGSPGLGKSRLIGEFMRRHGEEATILSAHCDVAGGATFDPLSRAFRSLLGLGDGVSGEPVQRAVEAVMSTGDEGTEAARIVRGVVDLLEGSPAPPEETFFVVRRFLVALTTSNPVVVVIDDLQWSEPLLLDLLEHLVQWGGGVPLFVLASARPELRELRSALVVPGGLVSDVVTLGGLDAGAAMRLAANVIGAADLPAAVAARVLATSEGNPLFVSELVRMLVQEGALQKVEDRWVEGEGLASLEMPPTIHALLAARIERLRPEERFVLERAAVVGRHFSRGAVASLLGGDNETLDAHLEVLTRSELIERDSGWFLGEPALRFHHLLIRDAAYRRLLKGTRAELHARLADWIEGRKGEASDQDETIGRHLEQAYLLLRELGPIDATARRHGQRASARLASAGRRALARDDLGLAAGLLGRALGCLPAADALRAELALDWCEALLAAGEVGPAVAAIEELQPFAADSERLRAWQTCFSSQRSVLTEPDNLQATADEVAASAAVLEKLEDAPGEAKAHSVHAAALVRLGKVGACEAALDRALAAARRAGDRRRANAVLAGAPVAALWGPSPVTRASGRCLDVVRVLRITQGAPAVEAVALSCQGVLEALRGRVEAARRMVASARKMVEELGIAQRLFEADVFAARIDLLENDASSAERLLRGAYVGLRELGLGIDAARAGALLARARLAQGDATDAETLSHESEILAGDDLQAAIAWRGVRAQALATRGEFTQAVELARAAVAIATTTDALLDHADARLALAATLRAAGRAAEADAEERQAVRLWEAKGATLLVERNSNAAGARTPVADQAVSSPTTAPKRRVRPNAATVAVARIGSAVAAGDLAGVVATTAEEYVETDHRLGVTFAREAMEVTVRGLLRAKGAFTQEEPMATVGESLALVRSRWGGISHGGPRLDVGGYESEAVCVVEVNSGGLLRRREVFAPEHLSEAISCLYRWHAESLPEGPARERAATASRAVGALVGSFEAERVAAVCSTDVEIHDHRRVGFGVLQGVEAVREAVQALVDLSETIEVRIHDVLALDDDVLVMLGASMGATGSGGEFERPACERWVFAEDGRIARWERFEAEDQDRALSVPGEELANPGAQRRVPRLVRRNAAVAGGERMAAAIANQDEGALADVFHEELHGVDHVNGVEFDRKGALRSFLHLLRADSPRVLSEPLATLGDHLALSFRRAVSSGIVSEHFDVGSYSIDSFSIWETDDAGRLVHAEDFGEDHLSDAIVVLYNRYAALLSESSDQDRAAATARSIEVLFAAAESGDLSQLGDVLSPDVQAVDHRQLGRPSIDGVEAVLRGLGSFFELADGAFVAADVLRLGASGFLNLVRSDGTVRSSGGNFETVSLMMILFDDHGRLVRLEGFDVDAAATATARFAELTGGGQDGQDWRDAELLSPSTEGAPSDLLVSNAATRLNEDISRAWAARDLEALEALHPQTARTEDRRRLLRTGGDGIESLENLRFLFQVPGSRVKVSALATRGQRLALSHMLLEGEAPHGGGPIEIECLVMDEVDDEGRSDLVVFFDCDDREAAFAELDAKYESGEAAGLPAFSSWSRRALAERDWEQMESRCAPGFVQYDHRSMALLGTTRGGKDWARNFEALLELAPQTSATVDHIRHHSRGYLIQFLWQGSREGGDYEIPILMVIEVEADKYKRIDLYDQEQLGEARTRFDAIRDPEERRHDLVTKWLGTQATASGERACRTIMALQVHDWTEFRAGLAPTFRVRDHRLLGWGDTLSDPDTMLRAQQTAVELSPDLRYYVDSMQVSGRGLFWHGGMAGQHEGGAFENPFLNVTEYDDSGLILFMDVYDGNQEELAGRRFDELRAPASPVVTQGQRRASSRFDNAAQRTTELVTDCWRRRDWPGFLEMLSPDFGYVDRRSTAHLELGREAYVEFARELGVLTSRAIRNDTMGSRGERLHLARMHIRVSGGDVGPSEMTYLNVLEVDEQGLLVALVRLGDNDVEEAWTELDRRYKAGEGARVPAVYASEDDLIGIVNGRRWDEFRNWYAEDFVSYDERMAGYGTLHGGRTHTEAIRAMVELAPDARLRVLHLRTVGPVSIAEMMWHGTRDGGAFESPFLSVFEVDEVGRMLRQHVYDPPHSDRAWARFDQACASLQNASGGDSNHRSGDLPSRGALAGAAPRNRAVPVQVPANEAWRVFDRWVDRCQAGHWEGLPTHLAPGFVYRDGRRLIRVEGGADMAIENARQTVGAGAWPERTLLATAGERLMLQRVLWTSRTDPGAFEIEVLSVVELDDKNRMTAVLIFDLDDEEAARDELNERFAAMTYDGMPKVYGDYQRALNQHDFALLRAIASDDYYINDHRRTGMGRLEGVDAHVSALQAVFELTSGWRVDTLFRVVAGPDGAVSVARSSGRNQEDGVFESYLSVVSLFRGETIAGFEFYEVEELDKALARFEEIVPKKSSTPPEPDHGGASASGSKTPKS